MYRYNGVATVQFPTSTEPTLGTWTVEAVAAESSAGAATSSSSVAAFTLDRYVLPTFEVKVAPDSPAVYKGQTSPVTGLVTAAYTYGEPLAGGSTFTLNVWQRSGGGGGGGVGFVGDIAMSRPAAGNAAALLMPSTASHTAASTSSSRRASPGPPPNQPSATSLARCSSLPRATTVPA